MSKEFYCDYSPNDHIKLDRICNNEFYFKITNKENKSLEVVLNIRKFKELCKEVIDMLN